MNDFKTDRTFKWQSQLGHADPISTYSTPEKTVRVYPQHTNTEANHNTQHRPHQEPYERNRRETSRQQGHEERQRNYNQYTPYRNHRGHPQYERTPQNGWKKTFWQNNNKKNNNGQNNWQRPQNDQRDNRGYPHNQRDNRGAPPHDNRGCPYETYGQRTRRPERYHKLRDGDCRGPPPQGPYQPYERSPVPTYNYYAPLSYRPD